MSSAQTTAQTSTASSLWSNRRFLTIWLGHGLSVLGDGFHSVALGLWVLQTTGSSTAMATVMTIRVAASVLLGAIAGTTVDRVNRRLLMIWTDLIRFALVGLTAYLVAVPGTSVWPIFLLTGLISICSQFFFPAFHASLINIVDREHLPKASSLLQMTNTVAQTVGPFLGGATVALLGGGAALVGDASSFLISALLLLIAGNFASPRGESKEHVSFWQDLREGVAYIIQQPLTRAVIVLAPLANFFVSAISVLIPVIAVKKWMASPVEFGMLEAAFPLGFAIGAMLVMSMMGKMRRKGWWIYGGMMTVGVVAACAVLLPSVYAALPVIPVIGVAVAIANVLMQIALQSQVPGQLQGRVFGTLGSLSSVASPVAMIAVGVLADL
ncbi:MAG TPA: MFS transporter, partial [Symbiobacteriaceae bacterium]|nr:MFS transporter [Symbiobacteriaceae bacterium]